MSDAAGAPVVFINGLIGTLRDPRINQELDGRRSLAPDLLGYGSFRDTSAGEIDIEAQIERVREAIEESLGDSVVHIVGHSVGGVVACLFAQRYPLQVASIISVEGNFTLNDAFWSSSVAKAAPQEVEAMLAGFQADVPAWLARSGIPAEPEFVSTAQTWLKHQPASTLQAMAKSVIATTGRADYLAGLKELFSSVPVHLLAGENSVGGWDIPDWAKRHAVSLKIMPNTGHLMMLEDPIAFGRVIAGLLE